jgi:hypothetical protein
MFLAYLIFAVGQQVSAVTAWVDVGEAIHMTSQNANRNLFSCFDRKSF